MKNLKVFTHYNPSSHPHTIKCPKRVPKHQLRKEVSGVGKQTTRE
jgi:hypothetical protein